MQLNIKRSVVPAAVLALVTIFVFYTLRDFGPGSAVRRFHEDLMSQKWADFQLVSTENKDSRAVFELSNFLKRLDESGATARLASMERSPSEVDVLVLYQAYGGERPFVWVVAKKEIGWQVDPYQTLLANPGLQNG